MLRHGSSVGRVSVQRSQGRSNSTNVGTNLGCGIRWYEDSSPVICEAYREKRVQLGKNIGKQDESWLQWHLNSISKAATFKPAEPKYNAQPVKPPQLSLKLELKNKVIFIPNGLEKKLMSPPTKKM